MALEHVLPSFILESDARSIFACSSAPNRFSIATGENWVRMLKNLEREIMVSRGRGQGAANGAGIQPISAGYEM